MLQTRFLAHKNGLLLPYTTSVFYNISENKLSRFVLTLEANYLCFTSMRIINYYVSVKWNEKLNVIQQVKGSVVAVENEVSPILTNEPLNR